MPLWRYEARRAGWTVFAAPLTALLVGVALALLAANGGSSRAQVGRMLLAGPEVMLPLAVGMAAVSMVARDGCRELQLSLPTRYAVTLGRRLGALALAGAVCTLLFSAVLGLTGWWTGPGPLASTLVWLPPTVWLTGLAVLVGMLGRSVVLATTVVATVWLGELLFAASIGALDWARPFFLFTTVRFGVDADWWSNRLALTGSGLLIFAVVALLLRRPHRLLTEEEV
ncbi:hypothetical protein [Plantactinospora sonchi]|uniref:ABC transporter permease n=1 Tax=Plantactinospora sonchi TaxID=1544735 RepID=A0ABU7S2Q8_9ACTN